ncbi:MAG TPA: TIGR01244 family sulfur transferase [Woeseiaceae bacterium]
MKIYQLSEVCSVASQIQPDDAAQLAEAGFKVVVCNRPDGEDIDQPTIADIGAACEAAGLEFHAIPIDRSGIRTDMVDAFRHIVTSGAGPVLAYCRSGQRSSILWQASGSP